MAERVVLTPIPLSCLALTEGLADSANKFYRIAPITQPNYTFLRIGNDHLIEPDILDHVDLHATQPASLNSRITDLGNGKLLEKRLGVYVHWTLPQFYRTGLSAAGSDANTAANVAAQSERQRQQGFPSSSSKDSLDTSQSDVTGAPQFRPVPNRWIVIRRLDQRSIQPQVKGIPTFQAWLVISDCLRTLSDLDDEDAASASKNHAAEPIDLEIDVTPFINVDPTLVSDNSAQLLEGQSEAFLGRKISIDDWDTFDFKNMKNVKLTVMSSSNPLFPDFTQHNMNVFTILDNFEYPDPKDKNVKLHLTKATADYFVLGFHSEDGDDPLTTAAPPATSTAAPPTNADRFGDLNMLLKDGSSDGAQKWLKAPAQSRILCHASMYGVKYDRAPPGSAPPPPVPATTAGQALFGNQKFAVGVSPIDALISYCRAHSDKDTGTMQDVEKSLLVIEALLRGKEADDVDGLQAAADESLEIAFQKVDSGKLWKLKDYTAQGQAPSTATANQAANMDKMNQVTALNALQECVDNLDRLIQLKSWSLFAEWWNWVAKYFSDFDPSKSTDPTKLVPVSQKRVLPLVDSINSLLSTQAKFQASLDKTLPSFPSLAQATPERFFLRKDPTLLFGSIRKGWDADFADKVKVRLDDQIMATDTSDVSGWETAILAFQNITSKKMLPSVLRPAISSLLLEVMTLRPENVAPDIKDGKPESNNVAKLPHVMPWYHNEAQRFPDQKQTADPFQNDTPYVESRSRDVWQEQPFQPLFVEWEAQYFHIPWQKWSLDEYDRFSHWGAKVVSYGVKEPLHTPLTLRPDGKPEPPKSDLDVRSVKGRNILMPQGMSTLRSTLRQIFMNTNPHQLEVEYQTPFAKQQTLLNEVADTDIVSFPMSGLTSQLITQFEGSHVKPLMKVPGKKSTVIPEALKDFTPIIADPENPGSSSVEQRMLLMDANTTQTPLGPLPVGQTIEPFKPVTHGQLTFTKINIIDKFGQAIFVLDPSPHNAANQPVVTPCMSDSYYPGTINQDDPNAASGVHGEPNIVIGQSSVDACPFISLPPSINQPARLNAEFMMRDSKTQAWRSCTDWDFAPDQNPIIGWFVVNYADQGLQIFLADGTFYREVRRGGRYKVPSKTSQAVPTPKWLPFEAPDDLQQKISAGKVKQLDFLIQQMTDDSYLQSMFDMINQAMDPDSAGSTLPHAPKTYATYTSAVVGRPIALVNAGWSLQLSQPEYQNWSTTGPLMPSRRLLQEDGSSWPDTQDPSTVALDQKTKDKGYYFNVKLGDFERNFDGLIGYFLPSSGTPSAPNTGPTNASQSPDLDFSKIYTYFTQSLRTEDHRVQSGKGNWPIFTPYYVDPTTQATPSAADHDSKLRRFGLLIDPFLPVHAYSAILPNKSLQLPSYLVEQVLSNITAFWRVGPVLVAEDVPAFNWANRLQDAYTDMLDTTLDAAGKNAAGNPMPRVALPIQAPVAAQGSQGASYRYLQPYWGADPATKPSEKPVYATHFNALAIAADAASGGDATQMKLQNGPYTMLEGYMQITKPIASTSAT